MTKKMRLARAVCWRARGPPRPSMCVCHSLFYFTLFPPTHLTFTSSPLPQLVNKQTTWHQQQQQMEPQ